MESSPKKLKKESPKVNRDGKQHSPAKKKEDKLIKSPVQRRLRSSIPQKVPTSQGSKPSSLSKEKSQSDCKNLMNNSRITRTNIALTVEKKSAVSPIKAKVNAKVGNQSPKSNLKTKSPVVSPTKKEVKVNAKIGTQSPKSSVKAKSPAVSPAKKEKTPLKKSEKENVKKVHNTKSEKKLSSPVMNRKSPSLRSNKNSHPSAQTPKLGKENQTSNSEKKAQTMKSEKKIESPTLRSKVVTPAPKKKLQSPKLVKAHTPKLTKKDQTPKSEKKSVTEISTQKSKTTPVSQKRKRESEEISPGEDKRLSPREKMTDSQRKKGSVFSPPLKLKMASQNSPKKRSPSPKQKSDTPSKKAVKIKTPMQLARLGSPSIIRTTRSASRSSRKVTVVGISPNPLGSSFRKTPLTKKSTQKVSDGKFNGDIFPFICFEELTFILDILKHKPMYLNNSIMAQLRTVTEFVTNVIWVSS